MQVAGRRARHRRRRALAQLLAPYPARRAHAGPGQWRTATCPAHELSAQPPVASQQPVNADRCPRSPERSPSWHRNAAALLDERSDAKGARQVGRRRPQERNEPIVVPLVSYMQLTQVRWSGACVEVGLQITVTLGRPTVAAHPRIDGFVMRCGHRTVRSAGDSLFCVPGAAGRTPCHGGVRSGGRWSWALPSEVTAMHEKECLAVFVSLSCRVMASSGGPLPLGRPTGRAARVLRRAWQVDIAMRRLRR